MLSVGYMAELVERCIGSHHGSMEIAYSREEQPLGTGGGVRLAVRLIRSDPVLVLNGDSYCHLDLPSLVGFHRERGGRGTLAVVQLPDASRYGRVRLDDARRVIGFDEKGVAEPGSINAGVYVLQADLLRSIPEGRPVSMEQSASRPGSRTGSMDSRARPRSSTSAPRSRTPWPGVSSPV